MCRLVLKKKSVKKSAKNSVKNINRLAIALAYLIGLSIGISQLEGCSEKGSFPNAAADGNAGKPGAATSVAKIDKALEAEMKKHFDEHRYQDFLAVLKGKKLYLSDENFNFLTAKTWLASQEYEDEVAPGAWYPCAVPDNMPEKLRKALDSINKAIAKDGNRAEFYVLRANIFRAGHMPLHQAVDLTEVISMTPEDPASHFWRAQFWREFTGEFEDEELAAIPDGELKETFKSASKKAPGGAGLEVSRSQSMKDADKALEIKPDYGEALILRAQLRDANNDLKGAIADLDMLLKGKDGDNSVMRMARADYLFKAGEWTRAIEDYSKALEEWQGDKDMLTRRAQCYTKLGKEKEAEADLKAASQAKQASGFPK